MTPLRLATDVRGLDGLRQSAGKDPQGAVREAARQFESLFMQEIMKSMRAATMASGLMDNEATKLGTEMLDTQLAGKMSGLPGGLADVIARQLERQMGLSPGPIPTPLTGSARANQSLPPFNPVAGAEARAPRIPERGAAAFVQQHSAGARAAEAASGIPAAFMLSQAALETGWGQRDIVAVDGTPSHNLFGIKAGAGWKGPVAEVLTTEYIDGKPQKLVQKFRAYASHAESFADYARLIKDSPRYQGVIDGVRAGGANADDMAKGFANGLQRAGYATDPAYASKLTRVINTTLRLQRSAF